MAATAGGGVRMLPPRMHPAWAPWRAPAVDLPRKVLDLARQTGADWVVCPALRIVGELLEDGGEPQLRDAVARLEPATVRLEHAKAVRLHRGASGRIVWEIPEGSRRRWRNDRTMSRHDDPLLSVVLNLSQFHREHEKFYSESPLHDAIRVQQISRNLKALAERWAVAVADEHPAPSPFAGARDLNDDRATESLGILFMEGEGEPAEIVLVKADLAARAAAAQSTGDWLAKAMDAAWGAAEALIGYPQLADLLAERHRIISNDWQAASMAVLSGRNLDRALAILERIDFSPAALRRDLAGDRVTPPYLFSAAELLDHASDLAAQSATLTHENERRWRVFHERVEHLTAA